MYFSILFSAMNTFFRIRKIVYLCNSLHEIQFIHHFTETFVFTIYFVLKYVILIYYDFNKKNKKLLKEPSNNLCKYNGII